MSVPSWCRVGAKVVCVREVWEIPRLIGETYPQFGCTYTIRKVDVEDGLWLEEIRNEPIICRTNAGRIVYDEIAFAIDAFRPLVDDKSDNEIEARLYQKRLKSQVISPKRVLVE